MYDLINGGLSSRHWRVSGRKEEGAQTHENDRSPEELSYNGDLLALSPFVMSWKQLKQSWFEQSLWISSVHYGGFQ